MGNLKSKCIEKKERYCYLYFRKVKVKNIMNKKDTKLILLSPRDQFLLESNFLEYKLNPPKSSKLLVKLNPPNESCIVDLKKMTCYEIADEDVIMPIYRKKFPKEKIYNKIQQSNYNRQEISLQKSSKSKDSDKNCKREKIEYLFFWKSNENAWNPKEKEQWSPFDLEDQMILNQAYSIYCLNPFYNKVEIKKPAEWYIDFNQMIQINKIDHNKQRPIQRSNPNLITNIARLNRFNNINRVEENDIEPTPEIIANIKVQTFHELIDSNYKYNKNKNKSLRKIHFNVIKNYKIELSVKDKLCFYNDNEEIKIPFENFIKILKDEITTLGKLYDLNYSIKFYIRELDKLEDSNSFFYGIIKMYTFEGFLYKKLNQYLRNLKTNYFEKIKLYYTSLLASFEYFSLLDLPEEVDTNEDLIVYRASKVFDSEFKKYEENGNKNITKIFNEFLSTSRDKTRVTNFFNKYDDSIKEYIWEIKIPKYMYESQRNNFAFIEKASVFECEKEVLLRSGLVILIEEIVPYSQKSEDGEDEITFKNKYIKKCSLKSFEFCSYCNSINFNKDIDSLNLQFCYLGTYTDNMHFLTKAMIFNQTILSMNLSHNSLGSNTTCMEYLKKILIKNNTIKDLNLSHNDIGNEKNLQSMKLLGEGLIENKSIQYLSLEYNYIGQNIDNVLMLNKIIIENPILKEIDLKRNGMAHDKKNVDIFIEALLKDTSKKILNLQCNFFDRNIMEELKKNENLNIIF